MSEAKTEEQPKKKKGKLLIILTALVLLLGGGGGAAFFFLKKPAADAEHAEADDERPAKKPKKSAKGRRGKADSHAAKTFVPLEPFTVNLQDPDQDRFAQVAVVFEVSDAKTDGEFKNLMPALRNAILMIISSKSGKELLTIEGKRQLALDIALAGSALLEGEPLPKLRSAPATTDNRRDARGRDRRGASEEGDDARAGARAEGRSLDFEDHDTGPITAVHFAQFIVQ